MSDILLDATGLRKNLGALVVIDNVSLRLAAGARHALIGPNGAGKTTLVQLLSGVLRPDAGSISLGGRDITHAPPALRVKQGLVRTFQINNLFPRLTLLENVFLAASEHASGSRRMFRPAARQHAVLERARTIIDELGLAGEIDRPIGEIAYGRQRLVEIALALCLEAKVLLLDEPTAGIPAGETARLLEAIDRLPAEIAILMIEHDMQVVRRFATQITVLVAGAVLIEGPPAAIMSSTAVRDLYLGRMGHERFAAKPLGA